MGKLKSFQWKNMFDTINITVIFLGFIIVSGGTDTLQDIVMDDNTEPIPATDTLKYISFGGINHEPVYGPNDPQKVSISLKGNITITPHAESLIEVSFYSNTAQTLKLLNEIKIIKERIEDIEDDIDQFKPRVGVRYKRSEIKNGSSKKGYNIPKSCKEVLDIGHNVSGLYQIQPKTAEKPFVVLCDMDTKGGGWTHIQKRFDGSQDFYLEWYDYKFGFGDLDGEFWIGLENMHKMTALGTNELLVELEDRDGLTAYAHYKAFSIASEKEGYTLKALKDYSGTAGDSLAYHLDRKFTTKDLDQDTNQQGNCAEIERGAWWYGFCSKSNPNGKYLSVKLPGTQSLQSMNWRGFRDQQTLAKSRILIRSA